jgi:hypothetical protein
MTIVSEKLVSPEVLWTNRQPDNINYLRPNGFKFNIQNLPTVSYFCQSASLPEVSLGTAMQSTPLIDIPRPGEKLSFGTLTIRFLIQENLQNYIELYNWMVGLAPTENDTQFSRYYKRSNTDLRKTDLSDFSDATLTVLNSDNYAIANFNFVDCFPISLSGMDFDTSNGSTQYFQGTASFQYLRFTVESTLK